MTHALICQRGSTARVAIQALEKTLEGEIREIANPLSRTYDVKVGPSQTPRAICIQFGVQAGTATHQRFHGGQKIE